jgi:hypothetical protein
MKDTDQVENWFNQEWGHEIQANLWTVAGGADRQSRAAWQLMPLEIWPVGLTPGVQLRLGCVDRVW